MRWTPSSSKVGVLIPKARKEPIPYRILHPGKGGETTESEQWTETNSSPPNSSTRAQGPVSEVFSYGSEPKGQFQHRTKKKNAVSPWNRPTAIRSKPEKYSGTRDMTYGVMYPDIRQCRHNEEPPHPTPTHTHGVTFSFLMHAQRRAKSSQLTILVIESSRQRAVLVEKQEHGSKQETATLRGNTPRGHGRVCQLRKHIRARNAHIAHQTQLALHEVAQKKRVGGGGRVS